MELESSVCNLENTDNNTINEISNLQGNSQQKISPQETVTQETVTQEISEKVSNSEVSILEQIKKLGDEWSYIDEKIKDCREDIKNLNNKKKELTDSIINKMRTNNIKCIDVNDGFLECVNKPTPVGLKKDKVQDVINKYVNNINKASEITNNIFDNKDVINKDDLKKIKKRRPKKKKSKDTTSN